MVFARSEKAAEDVGLYHAANAAGRLGGIILSGVLCRVGGIILCLAGSAVIVVACFPVTLLLPTRVGLARVSAQWRPRAVKVWLQGATEVARVA